MKTEIEREAIEKVKNSIFKSFDTIYKSCEIQAKSYKSDVVPLSFLKLTIETFKIEYEKALKL